VIAGQSYFLGGSSDGAAKNQFITVEFQSDEEG
jgi:hypothetical protein